MSRFTVPIADILGNAYYRYELSSSSYNPNIDNNITVTCTCKNVFGNPVINKTLELFQNNASVGTATTNANGIATWTVNCSSWGIQHFNVENKSIEVKVIGYKTTTPHSYYTLYEFEDRVGIRINISSNITFKTTWSLINNQVIPFRLRPRYPVTCPNYDNGSSTSNTAIGVRQASSGEVVEIVGKSLGSQVSTTSYAYLEWSKV